MRYNAIKRIASLALGGILTASLFACAAQTLEVKYDTLTLEAYRAQVAFQGEEDEAGWDCRVNGNATCGSTRYVALITPTDVTLVPHTP